MNALETSTSEWTSMRHEATEVRTRRMEYHQSSLRRMRLTRETFDRYGLTAQCLGCRAIRTGEGAPCKSHRALQSVKGWSANSSRSLKELPRFARDRERINRVSHVERASGIRTDDQISNQTERKEEELVRRALVTGLEATTSRPVRVDGSGDQIWREQCGDVDTGDPGRKDSEKTAWKEEK